MPADTPLWKAHDISQQLQDKIESLPHVERAFVHVDHETTHTPVSASVLCSFVVLTPLRNTANLSPRCETIDRSLLNGLKEYKATSQRRVVSQCATYLQLCS